MDIAALLSGIAPWHWLVLGLGLLVAELWTGTTHLLWPALAAWLTGLIFLVAPIAFPAQLLVFAGATLALTFIGRNRLKSGWLARSPGAQLNAPGEDLIGRVGVAESAFAHGEGRVRLGDSVWTARSRAAIPAGANVVVARVDGAVLEVEPQPEP